MKLPFALLFVLSAVSAAPVGKTKSFVMRGKQRRWLAADLRVYHRQMRKLHEDYIPLYPDAPILTNISVGTAPVNYSVALETGSEALFLLAADYNGRAANQSFYDPAQSSSSKEVGDFSAFSGALAVYGAAVTDLVGLYGQGCWENTTQRFGVVNYVDDSRLFDPQMPDGVLGLSWNPEDAAYPNENSSAVLNLFRELGVVNRSWCSWLEVESSPQHGRQYDFVIDYGGDLPDLCGPATAENTVQLFLLPESRSLAFLVDSFTYNGQQYFGSYGKVDTGVPTILMPFSAFLAVVDDVQPAFDWDYGLYTVDCSKAGSLLVWVFTIGGKEYAVPSTAYVVDLQLPDGQCALSVHSSDDYTTDYVLGYVFHQLWCIKMDVDHQTISLMEVRPQEK